MEGLQWSMMQIQAPEARAVQAGWRAVDVGILDSGIDGAHLDFRDDPTDPASGSNVDCARGRDFVPEGPGIGNPDPCIDNGFHGTHVAGIVAAQANNYGVVGVAPNVTLVPVKVCDTAGFCYSSASVAGITYAGDAKLDVINMSYFVDDDKLLASTEFKCMNDPTQRAYVTSIGGDGEQQHLTNIRLINSALAGKPEGMTVCTHMCRGNFRSSWVAEGGYDHVAEALFGELNVDGFFLEYDDARSGGFAPLRFVPRGPKKVVLGLVTTKRAALESKDELKRRIDEAAKYVPLDQLCLSPQCGFSSTVEGNALSIEEEKAKLRLVVETVREVWGD